VVALERNCSARARPPRDLATNLRRFCPGPNGSRSRPSPCPHSVGGEVR